MPTRVESKFANPPLGELRFKVSDEYGVERTVPALDKYWAPREVFANYLSLVTARGQIKTGVELEEWQYEAESFREDMYSLLHLPHHEFWSYMVYQKPALAAIVSFLQRATPCYVSLFPQVHEIDQHVQELYEDILNAVLRIICRLITNKESEKNWIAQDHLRELIYRNYLISVPMLFDLIIAVGVSDVHNTEILQKIFVTVMQIENNYKQDLLEGLNFFTSAFRSIETQAENGGFEGAGGGEDDDTAETPYDDVALYTLDCAYSLSGLLEVCSETHLLFQDLKLGKSIAHFYDNTIPLLYKHICQINVEASSLAWLNQARLQFLQAFRSIAVSFVNTVLMKPEESLQPCESFIALMTECLSEQLFVMDYQNMYPLELDMEILKQACNELDDFKGIFIVEGYKKGAESGAFTTMGSIQLAIQSQENNSLDNHDEQQTESTHVNGEVPVETASTDRDIDLAVSAVLDVFSDLGTGFVRKVLSRYENSEDAIAAILEDNLPPDLRHSNRAEVYIPPDPQDKLYMTTGLKHYNVHDGDEYDIMTQDNPKCIIKQGKGFPGAPQNAGQLLDDKRDLAKIRHRYEEYTMVSTFEDENKINDEYDDEYDDSYDAVLESETRIAKSKELNAGLANIVDVSDDSEEEQSEEETSSAKANVQEQSGRHKQMNFCENPEEQRARYEARRMSKWGNKGGNNRGDNNQAKSNEVTGNAKGQGQNKETLRNRNKKEVNKSSRANHNRKAGASFKRSKGMFT